MAEVLRFDEQFYIVADTQRVGVPTRVLKHGESFGVFDVHGDIVPFESSEQGLYHGGTRHVSRLQLLLGRGRPLLLSSTISRDNTRLAVDLTNPDIVRDGRVALPRGDIHVFRGRLLCNGTCIERIRVTNHGLRRVELPLTLQLDADFADVFEVRGMQRPRRGHRLPDASSPELVLRYVGLDDVERRTRVRADPRPDRAEPGALTWQVHLDPHGVTEIEIRLACESGPGERPDISAETAFVTVQRDLARHERECSITTSNESINRWLQQSAADLRMMTTETPSGPYPYAGIPWYSTPFGRDGLITALQRLWAAPDTARGVLRFLADTQATEVSVERDAEPGKILHEMRSGEMAALGEIPFGRYYGSADATPLFVVLAHEYYERTADAAFIDGIWPHLLAALQWMETHGDPDGDGFIEYSRQTDAGLVQQGWKDSYDSVFHDDGELAVGPIALCEVQGYAYAAWLGAARLAEARGETAEAERWRARAERLRTRFEEAFWIEDLGTYALALDGAKRPCRVIASNAGHCLLAGIVDPARARRVADVLLSDDSFGGWGVRTVAAGQARYNPMSYHNGSVWPHDNAIVALGLARYGFIAEATRILSAMADLSQAVEWSRLPELICGFHRRNGEFPTLYPVACAPQAWAAGAVFMLLQAALGLRIEAHEHRLTLTRAMMPESIEWVRVTNLWLPDGTVDLLLTRHPFDVGVTVLRREGDVEIVLVK